MRIALIAALAPALLAGGASAGPPTAPSGLDVDGREFALLSNHLWTVKGGADAKQVITLTKIRKGGTSARDRQELAHIWAPKCTAAAQTVIFKRSLFMPGPLKNFRAEFSDSTYVSAPADRAIGGVRLFINGRHVFSVKGASTRLERTERGYPQLFKHGINTFEIHAIKRAENKAKGTGLCKNGGRPLGLLFALEGEFEADLWLANDSSKTEEDYEKATPGATVEVPVGIEPRNLGPSGVYKGTLKMHISASTVKSMQITGINTRGPEIENCKVVPGANEFFKRVECELDRFPADRQRKLEVVANTKLTFHPTFTTAWIFVAAEVYSPTRDPNGRSNGWRAIRYFCAPEATNPKCPK